MKSISQNIILVLLGVFGVGAEEVKTGPVMEGDSVTLNPDLTDIDKYWQIIWRFEVELIAEIDGGKISYKGGTDGRFRDRLQLDSKTASLNITNMRRKHSGLYKLEATSSSIGTKYKMFSVAVHESPVVVSVGKVELKSVSVKEGHTVTLQTDVTELHGDELIVWGFGDEGKLIAKYDKEAKSSLLSDTDERFRDRLKLDEKTGSLTITNTRTTDSEIYTVKISSKQTSYKRFIVTVSAVPSSGPSGVITGICVALLLVFAAVAVMYFRYKRSKLEKQLDSIHPQTVVYKEGGFAVLRSDHKMKKGDQMLWRRVSVKEPAIASMSENDKTTYCDDLRFRGRLHLEPETGSLIIKYLRKTDAGVYVLEIKSTRGTSYRKYEVILSEDYHESDPDELKDIFDDTDELAA